MGVARTAAGRLLCYGARIRLPFVARCSKSVRISRRRSYPRRKRSCVKGTPGVHIESNEGPEEKERGANTAYRVSTACVIFPIIARDARHNRQLLHRNCHSAVAMLGHSRHCLDRASTSCSLFLLFSPLLFLWIAFCKPRSFTMQRTQNRTCVKRNPFEWMSRNCYMFCFSLRSNNKQHI